MISSLRIYDKCLLTVIINDIRLVKKFTMSLYDSYKNMSIKNINNKNMINIKLPVKTYIKHRFQSPL